MSSYTTTRARLRGAVSSGGVRRCPSATSRRSRPPPSAGNRNPALARCCRAPGRSRFRRWRDAGDVHEPLADDGRNPVRRGVAPYPDGRRDKFARPSSPTAIENRSVQLYPDENLDTDTCPTHLAIMHDAATNRLLSARLRGGTKPRILLAVATAGMGLFLGRAE